MINGKTALGIVLARGGSKRIPDKNIKELGGKPLIAWTLDAAKGSQYLDRTICTTDSEKIAAVAKEYGAEVPFMRPAELAADTVTDFPVFEHALQWLAEHEGYRPDIVVQLRPTSPLRTSQDIDRTIAALAEHPEADSARTVTEPEQSPYKMFRIKDAGYLEPLLTIPGVPESFNLPGQKLPKAYKHVGYVDAVWRHTLVEKKQMTGNKIVPVILENAYSGIDDIHDWELYEFLIRKRQEQ